MTRRLLKIKPLNIFVFMVVMFGTVAAVADKAEIDTNNVLHLKGRHNAGHACPVIDEHLKLTAAHVLDVKWYDRDFPLLPFRFSTDNGHKGIARPLAVQTAVDLGWLYTEVKVKPYRVAEVGPVEDDKVFWIEYNLDKKKDVFKTEFRDARFIREVAGVIFVDESPQSGASGGCAFNEAGEVIGIITSGWKIGSTYDPNVGGIAAVYGEWLPKPPDVNKEEK